jgi:hypothetical protein
MWDVVVLCCTFIATAAHGYKESLPIADCETEACLEPAWLKSRTLDRSVMIRKAVLDMVRLTGLRYHKICTNPLMWAVESFCDEGTIVPAGAIVALGFKTCSTAQTDLWRGVERCVPEHSRRLASDVTVTVLGKTTCATASLENNVGNFEDLICSSLIPVGSNYREECELEYRLGKFTIASKAADFNANGCFPDRGHATNGLCRRGCSRGVEELNENHPNVDQTTVNIGGGVYALAQACGNEYYDRFTHFSYQSNDNRALANQVPDPVLPRCRTCNDCLVDCSFSDSCIRFECNHLC